MEDNFKTRLKTEFSELSDKINKLEAFTHSKDIDKIDVLQQQLLIVQLDAMRTYCTCLNQRLFNLK